MGLSGSIIVRTHVNSNRRIESMSVSQLFQSSAYYTRCIEQITFATGKGSMDRDGERKMEAKKGETKE